MCTLWNNEQALQWFYWGCLLALPVLFPTIGYLVKVIGRSESWKACSGFRKTGMEWREEVVMICERKLASVNWSQALQLGLVSISPADFTCSRQSYIMCMPFAFTLPPKVISAHIVASQKPKLHLNGVRHAYYAMHIIMLRKVYVYMHVHVA